jgi:Kef-type K+ transport system membrane component KefB
MDVSQVLRDILVVLVAAKVAAELAERVGVPAVVGEILAGILIGPSVLGAVNGTDEVLRTLGELGVILLLLDVGLEMDLTELGKVGRASVLVATVGVVSPMFLGIGAMELLGADFKTSLFVGAALTATSVGITARVFGDLRALATTEARIVLGAAVADDVMGLVVLTVVVRLVTEGSVSVSSVGVIVAVALAFLAVGGAVGLRVAPPLFAAVERASRSTGTLVAIALAFTLGYAELANAAKLAPIVGAFVAGIALSRSRQSDRVRRELAPVGHLFIPVFFLEIGIDADISAFTRGAVLRDAAVLLAVAAVGKLVSPLGARGTAADRQLIGLGMLPRGEVGLIFATIGLQNHVLDDNLYAALLVVVLVTTLVTPQLLKMRYARLRAKTVAESPVAPPDRLRRLLDLAIEAARGRTELERADELRPATGEPLAWDGPARERLLDVIERGNARSWRFLAITGTMASALPEVDAALHARDHDGFAMDPLQAYRCRSMERLRALDGDDPLADEILGLDRVDDLLLAAWLADVFDELPDPSSSAAAVLRRVGISGEQADAVIAAVRSRDLLWTAAHQPGGLTERAVLPLAAHFGNPNAARLVYTLSALRAEGRERWQLARLEQLHDLIQAVLSSPRVGGEDAVRVDDVHRREAAALIPDDADALARLRTAPRAYVLAQEPAMLARHAVIVDPLPPHGRVRVARTGSWTDVVARDRPGLLAATAGALTDCGLDVREAVVAVWEDGAALQSFRVDCPDAIDEGDLARRVERGLDQALHGDALADAQVEFVDAASPWHTVCEVHTTDRPGVLRSLAVAFAAHRVDVLALSATSEGRQVIDRFEVVDRRGEKLDTEVQRDVERAILEGVVAKRTRGARRLARRR